jgi:SAM-dependent methyltransferase
MGEQFYRWQFEQSACRSVRARRNLLAEKIDALAENVRRPRILAVACGHLREAQQSRAVAGGRVDRFFAVDQDPDSLDLVDREQRASGIEAVNASVRSLVAGKSDLEDLDLVYSAGLFNYLADATAVILTRALFDMLRPGGSVLIANFAPNLPDIGLMEAGMDWWLTYRDEAACERLTLEIPGRHPRRVFRDRYHNIVFVEVGKLG